MKRDLFVLICALLLVGCAAPPTEGVITAMPATEARVAASTAVEQATERVIAPTLAATVVPSATILVQEPLSEEGPWRVYNVGGEDIYVTNADGSGYLDFSVLESSDWGSEDISSQYHLISIFPGNWLNDYLYIYDLLSGNLIREIDLLICPNEFPDCEFDGEFSTAFMEWSPDGRYLAFAAARGSLSTDLYIYDAEIDEIIQLTFGDNQVGDLYWSPDSQWIVHEEVLDFRGWQVEAIWAAQVDGSEVNWLTEGADGNLNILAWVSDENFISWTDSIEAERDIRLIDVNQGLISTLFKGHFRGYMFVAYNPIDHVIGFWPMVGMPDTENYFEGVYLVSPYQTTPYYTGLDERDKVFWDPISGDFIALGYECTAADGTAGDAYAFNIDRKIECVIAPEWQPVEEQLDYIVVGGGE